MAQAWYLLKSPHSQLSGFENDALNDFANEGFEEILETNIASDVELCNYDLSVCTPIRVVIQNRTQDTKLKALNRHMLAPIGTCKAGMYVKYKNRYWLIVGLVDDNGTYEKAILVLCNYLLSWINEQGKVIQRWVNITSASQYNHGETGSRFYNIRSDQLLIVSPNDDECVMLDTGIRFVIDKRCKLYEKSFNDTVVSETSKKLITYTFTRTDGVLYDYQDSGHYEFMVVQDEQCEEDGYYVIDGKGYWLCKKPSVDVNKSTILSSSSFSLIECESNEIYDGLEAGIFTAKFYDASGNEVFEIPQWKITCDFVDDLNVEYVDNSILISVDNEKLVNKEFELSLNCRGYESNTITIAIKAFL